MADKSNVRKVTRLKIVTMSVKRGVPLLSLPFGIEGGDFFLSLAFLTNWTIFGHIKADIYDYNLELSICLVYTHFILHFDLI